jgi:hypothetical protein
LVIYCQTFSVSAAHDCAAYCTPCRPLIRAFSGWILSPPPTPFSFSCPFRTAVPAGSASARRTPCPLFPILPFLRLTPERDSSCRLSRLSLYSYCSAIPTPPPAAPIVHTSLPNPSRPTLEASGAYPLDPAARRAHSGASRCSPPLRTAGASLRPLHPAARLALSFTALPQPALHSSWSHSTDSAALGPTPPLCATFLRSTAPQITHPPLTAPQSAPCFADRSRPPDPPFRFATLTRRPAPHSSQKRL